MLETLRKVLLGSTVPPSGPDAIPTPAREAHHRLRNTAMKMKQTARAIDEDANGQKDILETLARDIKRRKGQC